MKFNTILNYFFSVVPWVNYYHDVRNWSTLVITESLSLTRRGGCHVRHWRLTGTGLWR